MSLEKYDWYFSIFYVCCLLNVDSPPFFMIVSKTLFVCKYSTNITLKQKYRDENVLECKEFILLICPVSYGHLSSFFFAPPHALSHLNVYLTLPALCSSHFGSFHFITAIFFFTIVANILSHFHRGIEGFPFISF